MGRKRERERKRKGEGDGTFESFVPNVTDRIKLNTTNHVADFDIAARVNYIIPADVREIF